MKINHTVHAQMQILMNCAAVIMDIHIALAIVNADDFVTKYDFF
jgi:hypothetical protein